MERNGVSWGYLFLSVNEVPDGQPTINLEFYRGSLENDSPWYYSDRYDPEDYDTVGELSTGTIDWYGRQFTIRWISGDEDARVRAAIEPPYQPSRLAWLSRSRGKPDHRKKFMSDNDWVNHPEHYGFADPGEGLDDQ